MSRIQIVGELFQSIFRRKKYFLAPIVIILLLMMVLILLVEIPVLTPFIYAIF